MKNCVIPCFSKSAVIAFIILFSSCAMVTKSHLGDKARADERIKVKNIEEEKIWSTNDLSIEYTLVDKGDVIDLSGLVEISTSVVYTFPLVDYLYIYVYLLDREGVATSRYSLQPNISRYNIHPERGAFSANLAKDQETVSIAFGYLGNFVSIEREEYGRRQGYERNDWQIYHDPFE